MRFAMAGITGIKKKFPGMEYTYTHITHTYIHIRVKKDVHGEKKAKTFLSFPFPFFLGHSLDHFQTRGDRKLKNVPA